MKHLIIGCGISGIHIAIQLLDNGTRGDDILILEKSGYNCSKLFTIKENAIRDDGKHEEIILEMGPSVIHSRQEEILKLISKLGLLNTMEKVNPKEKAFYVYPNLPSDEVKQIWKELKKRVFEVEDVTLTLKEASKKVLNNKEYNILKTCWGEWHEVCDCNLQILKKSMGEEGEYLIMKGGFDQIITKGIEYLEKQRVNIKFETEVTSLKDLRVYDSKRNEYVYEKLYICGNYKGINSIKTDIPLIKDYLSLGKSKNCLRFYVYFKKKVNIPYKFIFGNFLGKYSIKYSDRLWLIAYPDGELATKLNKMNKRKIVNDWIKMVNNNFELDIKTRDIGLEYCCYWEDAYSILKKEGVTKANIIHNKLKENNIIITCLPKNKGESSAWMEGHLYKL
jgi:hypothetical protein